MVVQFEPKDRFAGPFGVTSIAKLTPPSHSQPFRLGFELQPATERRQSSLPC